ncbi:MAG: hypothetical protein FJY75_08310 [Candidatus Eisenbacteria bacterium]|uniref:Uncharacterized protein n=1 Tax=Eiseniibacteriota bacterium TaxID=2212470 RepID=A0A937X8H5_UNCEI|nr:hypothetical protein [Candidatus Eisenbacteria bacterium]
MEARGSEQGSRAASGLEDRRGFRPRSLLWPLSPLLYIFLALEDPWLPDAARAALGLAAVLILPGWLLHDLILPRPRVGPTARLARAFLLSVALVAVLGLAAWFCSGDAALGPVAPPGAAPPPFPGSLTSILWGLGGFLFLAGVASLLREAFGRHGRGPRLGGGKAAGGKAAGGKAAAGEAAAGEAAAGEATAGEAAVREAAAAGGPASPPPAPRPGPPREGEDPWQGILRRAYRLSEEQRRERRIAPRWATTMVLAVILAAAAVLCFHAGGHLGYRTDSPDHIGCLREMIERDRVLPRTAFHADGDGTTLDARKGFFHVALALVARLTGLDPLRLWQLLPGLLAPLALIVFHTLARRVLRSEGTALFATFLALVCFGEVQRGLLTRLAYGNAMGGVLAWGVIALALRFVRGDARPGVFWLLALGALGAAATHAFAAVQIGFSLGALIVALLCARGPRDRRTRRLAAACGAALLGMAGPTLWRVLYASGSANPIHTHRQGVIYLSERLFLISPAEWGAMLGAVGIAGVLLSFALWRRAREGEGVLYLATLSLAPMLILLNPVAVPLLEPLLGYLVARFALLVPYVLVLAYVAGWMGQALLDLHSARRVVKALLFYAAMVALLFPRFEAFARSHSSRSLEALERRSILQWREVMERLDQELPGPAVILSDPITGYCIPALTRHFTVTVLHQHGSPADTLALARLAGARDVLSPYIGTGEKARICRRFGVDYVFVNGDFAAPVDLFLCQAGRELAARQRSVLDEDDLLLRRLWDLGPDGALYAVRAENLDRLSGIVGPGEEPPASPSTEARSAALFVRAPPEQAIPVLPDTAAGLTLTAIALDTLRLAAGGELGATLYWRRVGAPGRFPAEVHLRLAAEVPAGRMWVERLSKLSRLLVERRTHRHYRHRSVHTPLDGQLGAENWPRDRYVVDQARIRVPERAARSSHLLKVRWMEASFLPNLPLRHLYSDEDAYEGVPAGMVEVY